MGRRTRARGPRRLFYLAAGWLCVALATAGALLPVLPTTPFLILAAGAFARSSPALARRLYRHRRFGPLLRDWERYGVIPLKAKLLATVMMGLSLTWLGTRPGVGALTWLLTGSLMACGLAYVWSRPHRRPPPG